MRKTKESDKASDEIFAEYLAPCGSGGGLNCNSAQTSIRITLSRSGAADRRVSNMRAHWQLAADQETQNPLGRMESRSACMPETPFLANRVVRMKMLRLSVFRISNVFMSTMWLDENCLAPLTSDFNELEQDVECMFSR
jgi:hypothetical protein